MAEREDFLTRMWDVVLSDQTPSYTIKEVELKSSAREHMMKNTPLFDRKLGQVSSETLLPLQRAGTFAMVIDPESGTVVAVDEENKVIGQSGARGFFSPQRSLGVGDARDATDLFLSQFPEGGAQKIDTDTMNKLRYAAGAISLVPSASFSNAQAYLDDLVVQSKPEPIKVEDPTKKVEGNESR